MLLIKDYDIDFVPRERGCELKLHKQVNRMKQMLELLRTRGNSVILYGASLCGMKYLDVLRNNDIVVTAFCDDNTLKQKSGFCGLPVISPAQLSTRGGTIVVSSYGPEKIYRKIADMDGNLLERTCIVDFYLWENALDYFNYFMQYREEIDNVSSILEDEKSKQVFWNCLNYKISRNNKLIQEIRDDVNLQYFDGSIVHFSESETFLDLGAYIGDTIDGFVKKVHGEYKNIYAFEPDSGNMAVLKQFIAGMDNVTAYPYGAGEKDEILHFRSEGNWTSEIDDSGEDTIVVRSVDSFLQGNSVSFIKADIEGAEFGMLRGAKETICKYKPKLAIAVYHRKDDIFSIPLLLKEYRSDYKFYLRHYTEMPIDTVLYAV